MSRRKAGKAPKSIPAGTALPASTAVMTVAGCAAMVNRAAAAKDSKGIQGSAKVNPQYPNQLKIYCKLIKSDE